jgi:hypothetical protein
LQSLQLFHGTNGDNILEIIRTGKMLPSSDGKLFFSQFDWTQVLQHGPDTKRKATFVIAVTVQIPPTAKTQSIPTPGAMNTLVVLTTVPIAVEVKELFIREPHGSTAQRIVGAGAIAQYLRSRVAPP